MVQSLLTRLLTDFLNGLQVIIISAFTAAITVGLTFWYRRKYERRQALIALKSEIFHNNSRFRECVLEFSQVDSPIVATPEATTTSYLDTNAFDNLNNSGLLFDLNPYDAGAISSHYQRVKMINRQLERRDGVYYNLEAETMANVIEKIEEATLIEVGALMEEHAFNHLIEDEVMSKRVKIPLRKGRRANTAFSTEGITVDNLMTIINRELESDLLIVRWLIGGSLYGDAGQKHGNTIPTTEEVHGESSSATPQDGE